MMPFADFPYLHVCWYRLRDDTADLASTYFDLAVKSFPAAVPTRYATHEPMRGRFPRDGYGAFGQLYRDECEMSDLTFRGKSLGYGLISDWSNKREARYQRLHIRFDLPSLVNPDAIAALEVFFREVAIQTDSFFAFAEVNDSPLDTAVAAPVRGAWPGLPARPQWLVWFSPEYAEIVRPYLAAGDTTSLPEGTFHRWTVEPAGEAEIRSWILDDPWVPYELLPIPNPGNSRRPFEQASLMPDSLRAPAQGSPEWRRIESYYSRDIGGGSP